MTKPTAKHTVDEILGFIKYDYGQQEFNLTKAELGKLFMDMVGEDEETVDPITPIKFARNQFRAELRKRITDTFGLGSDD